MLAIKTIVVLFNRDLHDHLLVEVLFVGPKEAVFSISINKIQRKISQIICYLVKVFKEIISFIRNLKERENMRLNFDLHFQRPLYCWLENAHVLPA